VELVLFVVICEKTVLIVSIAIKFKERPMQATGQKNPLFDRIPDHSLPRQKVFGPASLLGVICDKDRGKIRSESSTLLLSCAVGLRPFYFVKRARFVLLILLL
jgi:hypothetical protein